MHLQHRLLCCMMMKGVLCYHGYMYIYNDCLQSLMQVFNVNAKSFLAPFGKIFIRYEAACESHLIHLHSFFSFLMHLHSSTPQIADLYHSYVHFFQELNLEVDSMVVRWIVALFSSDTF